MNMEVAVGLATAFAGFALYRAKNPVLLGRRRVLPPRPGRGECKEHDGSSAIVIPMRSDSNDIFLIDLGIMSDSGKVQWVKTAVDTGSEALMIASEDCDGCEEGRHLGTIENDGAVLRRSTVRYGSQQDTVNWVQKRIRIPAWDRTCDPFDRDGVITENPVQCIVGNVSMGIVQKRTGTSDYNILGLGSQTATGPPAVLKALFPKASVRAFTIEVYSRKEARLILHRPDDRCHPPKFKFEVRPKHLGHAHHYLVTAQELRLYKEGPKGGDNPGTMMEGSFAILFDTGANALSLPPSIYDKVFSMTSPRGKLSLTLKSMSGHSVVLDFDFDRSDRENMQVLKAKSNDMLIIGVTFLIGKGLGYEDHGSYRVLTMDFL